MCKYFFDLYPTPTPNRGWVGYMLEYFAYYSPSTLSRPIVKNILFENKIFEKYFKRKCLIISQSSFHFFAITYSIINAFTCLFYLYLRYWSQILIISVSICFIEVNFFPLNFPFMFTQTFSIGLRSLLYAGQSITTMLFSL